MKNDQAIPFEKKYSAFDAKQAENVTGKIKTLAANEKLTVQILDEIMPAIVGHVCGGGNIAVVNQTLKALRGERQKVAIKFLTRYVPHEFRNNGTFGKKLDKPKALGKIRAFRNWEAKDQKYSEWGTENIKIEAKPVDFGKLLQRDVRKAIEKGGLSVDEVLAIVQAAAMEEQAVAA